MQTMESAGRRGFLYTLAGNRIFREGGEEGENAVG
jgi:hypothetical protein